MLIDCVNETNDELKGKLLNAAKSRNYHLKVGDYFIELHKGIFYYNWFEDLGIRILRRIEDELGRYPASPYVPFTNACLIFREPKNEVEVEEVLIKGSTSALIAPYVNAHEFLSVIKESEIRDRYLEIVELVERLESIGVLHGDVHAGNIMFAYEKPILVDFDQSALLDDDSSLDYVGFGFPSPIEVELRDVRFKDLVGVLLLAPDMIAANDIDFLEKYDKMRKPEDLLNVVELERVFGKEYLEAWKEYLRGDIGPERPVRRLLELLTT